MTDIINETLSLTEKMGNWSIPEIPEGREGMYLGGGSELNDEMIQMISDNQESLPDNIAKDILRHRVELSEIINGKSNQIAIFMGPCSISSARELIDTAKSIKEMQDELEKQGQSSVTLVMRAYLEKPRTNAFDKDGSPMFWGFAAHGINSDRLRVADPQALEIMRASILQAAEIGVPIISEFLNMETYAAIGDLVTSTVVGARTVEDENFIKMARHATSNGITVGWKNDLNGKVDTAAKRTEIGGMVILRGGQEGPNWDLHHQQMVHAATNKRACIDAAHGNSGKDPRETLRILNELSNQLKDGHRNFSSVMFEWNLENHPSRTDKGLTMEDVWSAVKSMSIANS